MADPSKQPKMDIEKKAQALSYVARQFPETALIMRGVSKPVGSYENTMRSAYSADHGNLFMIFVRSGNIPKVLEALSVGLPKQVLQRGFLEAIRYRNEAMVRALLPKVGDVNFVLFGQTPLLAAVSDHTPTPIVKLLLDAGANPNLGVPRRRVFSRPDDIMTPLEIALVNALTSGNTTETVKDLVDYGAKVTPQIVDDWDSRYRHTVGLGYVNAFEKANMEMRKKWDQVAEILQTHVSAEGGGFRSRRKSRSRSNRSRSQNTRKARKAFKRNTYKRRSN